MSDLENLTSNFQLVQGGPDKERVPVEFVDWARMMADAEKPFRDLSVDQDFLNLAKDSKNYKDLEEAYIGWKWDHLPEQSKTDLRAEIISEQISNLEPGEELGEISGDELEAICREEFAENFRINNAFYDGEQEYRYPSSYDERDDEDGTGQAPRPIGEPYPVKDVLISTAISEAEAAVAGALEYQAWLRHQRR